MGILGVVVFGFQRPGGWGSMVMATMFPFCLLGEKSSAGACTGPVGSLSSLYLGYVSCLSDACALVH